MADFLQNIKSAAVLLDADAPDFDKAALAAEKYFHARGISLQLKAVHRGSWFFLRRSELLLSLLPRPGFFLSAEARRSRASLKLGRFQLSRSKTFDIIVSDNPKSPSLQTEVFKQMTEILESIK